MVCGICSFLWKCDPVNVYTKMTPLHFLPYDYFRAQLCLRAFWTVCRKNPNNAWLFAPFQRRLHFPEILVREACWRGEGQTGHWTLRKPLHQTPETAGGRRPSSLPNSLLLPVENCGKLWGKGWHLQELQIICLRKRVDYMFFPQFTSSKHLGEDALQVKL